jgi:spermidine/putrescine transport system permease protein
VRFYGALGRSKNELGRADMKDLKLSTIGIYTVAYLAFLYIPVLLLPMFSFNDSLYMAFPLEGFTLRWYEQMINSEPLIDALKNSLRVASCVSILSTIFGTLAAKAFTKYKLPGEKFIGIALLVVLKKVFDVPLSLFTVGFAHTIICVPFSMFVMISRLEGFDKSIEEAAQDLGETPWMSFWRVTFPLAMPGILASLLMCFTISFDEVVLAFFLGSDKPTLPLHIWSQLRFPDKLPPVLALGATIFTASFIVVTFAEWYRRRGIHSK